MRIPFVGAAYSDRSLNMNAQRCVNLIPETDPSGKNVMALYGRPGLKLFTYIGLPPIRLNGTHVLNDVMYAVCDGKMYSILGNGTFTVIGNLLTTSGPVSMGDNGTQIMVADGPYGYIYNTNTGG